MPKRKTENTKRLFGFDDDHPFGEIVWPTLDDIVRHLVVEHEDIYVMQGVARPDRAVRATPHHLDLDWLQGMAESLADGADTPMPGFMLIGYGYDLHAKFQCEPF